MLLTGVAAAAPFDPFKGPTPLAVLIEHPPSEVSDGPRVAVYADGDVIFIRKAGRRSVYHKANLGPTALRALTDSWQPLLNGSRMDKNYSISTWTHDGSTIIFLQGARRMVVTGVYGLTCERQSQGGFAHPEKAPPADLVEVHKRLCAIDAAEAKEWVPPFVEVTLWDYSSASEVSIHWPKAWPGLKSDRAKRRVDGYSIFLDGTLLPELRTFLATQREKGAVEIAGKKWEASYRHTFPNEPVWLGAISQYFAK
jgi:hypothetical protein